MRYYAIVELELTDPSWVEEYVRDVTPMVEARGGRFRARTTTIEQLEGEPRGNVMLLIDWPDKESAVTFHRSDEYRPYLEKRRAGSRTHLRLVAAEDVTGTARIDP